MILLKQLFHNPDVIFNVLDHKIQFWNSQAYFMLFISCETSFSNM